MIGPLGGGGGEYTRYGLAASVGAVDVPGADDGVALVGVGVDVPSPSQAARVNATAAAPRASRVRGDRVIAGESTDAPYSAAWTSPDSCVGTPRSTS